MPFEKKNPDPKGGINSLKYHKTLMNRIVNDETLSGNRRLLAEVIFMWMSSYGREKEILETILLGAGFTKYQDTRGVMLKDINDAAKQNTLDERTQESLEVREHVKAAMRLIEGE